MRNGLEPMKELTLGSYLRGERNLRKPFGFYELPGFALLVRCTLLNRGDGSEESMRIKVEYRPLGARLKESNKPESVIDWPFVSSFDPVLRLYALKTGFDFDEPHTVYVDGLGTVIPQ